MQPLTISAMIAGGMSGTWMFNLLDGGLVAGPSPGSIFRDLALTPKGSIPGDNCWCYGRYPGVLCYHFADTEDGKNGGNGERR